MEPEPLYNLLQVPKEVGPPPEDELSQGAVPRGWGPARRGGSASPRAHTALLSTSPPDTQVPSAPAQAFRCILIPASCFWKLPQLAPHPAQVHTSRIMVTVAGGHELLCVCLSRAQRFF